MTLMEFQVLSVEDQINVLYKDGVYIGKRKQAHLIRLLFQVDSFYVEVAYRMYRRYIAAIRCSGSTSLLDPYLEQIDVEHLVG
jgi:hypothetical protein